MPWNLPLLLLTWKVAPALACGNAVVVKPSEETPSTATLLAEVMADAGVPAGVFNVVHGFGAVLRRGVPHHPRGHRRRHVHRRVGHRVSHHAGGRAVACRPVSFELGGKNAALVFADADLDEAVDGLSRSVFTNTGQVCLCTERVYVERPVFDDVVAGLVAKARALRLGRPEHPDTTTGPLISVAHREKVLSYLALARDEGADTLVGGGIPDLGADLAGGAWIEPTLWAGLDNGKRAIREEIFGPVAALIPFDTEEEAVRVGQRHASTASRRPSGPRISSGGTGSAQRMRVGMAWVNTWFLRDLRTPFGGVGLSGIGREGGEHSLHFYTEPTNVCVQL